PAGELRPGTGPARAAARLTREARPKLRPVINATGVVLHTNLGRAPAAEEAARAAYDAARGYLNLELDLDTGKRSSRSAAVRDWLCRLTGAAAATAVNNCAAATVLVLRALAALVALGRQHGVPVVDDVGSGALVDFAQFGLTGEPLAAESIRAGADLVLFSGDKLLGGPQAGIVAGRRELVQRVERDSLMR